MVVGIFLRGVCMGIRNHSVALQSENLVLEAFLDKIQVIDNLEPWG